MGKRIYAKRTLSHLLLLLMLTHCSQKSETYEEQIMIKGGLIIQTGWNSTADEDIENGFVLIEKGKIKQVVIWSDTISYPKKTKIIDANGKYIVPGLIDGFAVINNQAFVHTTRYSLDIAPENMAKSVANEPFSDQLDSPKWKYYQYLSSIDVTDSVVLKYAKKLGSANSHLMPTLSLLYLDLLRHENPWNDPLADLINANDINNRADKVSGNHNYSKEVQAAYTNLALKVLELEQQYYRKGAKYLTGSACDVWGTMPGISLHAELELLQKIGLTDRQILASASANFSDAFGWKKGKIAEGYDADILILDENPLENIENLKKINLLLLKGEVIS